MVKRFACGDVVDGCGWSTSANTEEEIFRNVEAHAKDAHGMLEIPTEILQKVKAKIKDA